jgi:hypothetical protein
VTTAAEFVLLSATSCTASGWFLGVGALLVIGAIYFPYSLKMDELPLTCFGTLFLVAGCALAGVGINSFLDGCG